jgi:hypothetical protein
MNVPPAAKAVPPVTLPPILVAPAGTDVVSISNTAAAPSFFMVGLLSLFSHKWGTRTLTEDREPSIAGRALQEGRLVRRMFRQPPL